VPGFEPLEPEARVPTTQPCFRKNRNTVNIRNPDRPVFEWSFFGHFLNPLASILYLKIGRIRPVSNGKTSLDRFINKKIMPKWLSLAFQKPDHLATGHKSTIGKPDWSRFWMVIVFV
jgi:hypothetical protein